MSQVALGMRIWSLVAYQSSHKEAWRRTEPGGKPTGKPIPQRHCRGPAAGGGPPTPRASEARAAGSSSTRETGKNNHSKFYRCRMNMVVCCLCIDLTWLDLT